METLDKAIDKTAMVMVWTETGNKLSNFLNTRALNWYVSLKKCSLLKKCGYDNSRTAFFLSIC